MNRYWLPEGSHWGLNITHHPLEDAGEFAGGGHKFVWHTTEGGNTESVIQTLDQKRAAPHLIANIDNGHIVQCIPFNRAGRALQHTGGPETNRANAIQCEIVGFARESEGWSHAAYASLAAMAVLVEHRFYIRRVAPVSFTHPHRLTGEGFLRAEGHFGHVHVPENDHVDPGPFRIGLLFRLMHQAERDNA